jgi:hypothetical protein
MKDIFDKPYTLRQYALGAIKGLVIALLLVAILTAAGFGLALELQPQ